MSDIEKEVALLHMLYEQVTELFDGVYYAGEKVNNKDLFIGNNKNGIIINFNTHKEIDVTSFIDKTTYNRPKIMSFNICQTSLFIKNMGVLNFIEYYFTFIKSYISNIAALRLDYEKNRTISFFWDNYHIVYNFYIDNTQSDDLILNLTYSNNEKKHRVIKNIKEKYDKLLELKDIIPFNSVKRVSIDNYITNRNNTDIELLSLIDKNYVNKYMKGCKDFHSININDINEEIQVGA